MDRRKRIGHAAIDRGSSTKRAKNPSTNGGWIESPSSRVIVKGKLDNRAKYSFNARDARQTQERSHSSSSSEGEREVVDLQTITAC